MNSKELLEIKNLRKQAPDEIIIDIDDREEHGVRCFSAVGILLVNAGYHIELWYAEGMKQPHIHIKEIPHIADLTKEQGTRYRKLFYEKYIPKEFWNEKIPDFSICNPYEEAYHPIAEENKPHYKYKTIKTLRSEFNKDKINFCEPELYNQAKKEESKKITFNIQRELNGDYLYQKIASKISIIYMADCFGLKPLGRRLRNCPFHADKTPSLFLDERGIFNCFGSDCKAKGNIIKFYAMLKKLNPNFKLELKNEK